MERERVRVLRKASVGKGPVVYWMSREQRIRDNWALIHAQELSKRNNIKLQVVFCLVPDFIGATIREYSFMLEGLKKIEKELRGKTSLFFFYKATPERRSRGF